MTDIQSLSNIAQHAARTLSERVVMGDIESYKALLRLMYYYTKNYEKRYKIASDSCRENRALSTFYLRIADRKDEQHQAVKDDLIALGETLPTNAIIPNIITEYDAWWDSLKGGGLSSYAGAIYVNEMAGIAFREYIKAYIYSLNISEDKINWLSAHIGTETIIGYESQSFLSYHIDNLDHVILLDSANQAADFWIKIYSTPFV